MQLRVVKMDSKTRKSPYEKLKENIRFLLDQKEIIEAAKERYITNVWTIKKLILLSRFIYPYLVIATDKKQNGTYKYFNSWFYIDLFSGPGASSIGGMFDIIGSPIVSLLKGIHYIDKREDYIRFTKWFFGDVNKDFCSALEKRRNKTLELIEQKHKVTIPKKDVHILPKDANKNIDTILNEIEKYEKISILAFIDPEGFTEIKWSTLKKLFERKYVDIIYILSTGGVKRGLRPEHLEKNLPPLSDSEKTKYLSGKYSCADLVEMFVKKILKELHRYRLFYYSIPIYNEKNTEIYRIVWTSCSKGAASSVENTINFLQRIKNEDLFRTIQVVLGKQLELKDFLSKTD